ncbi:hypothetical protein FB45DRAFT_1002577 [Roridomyces roridus]|uniref:DUF7779 domain-containing protein n=1 Tax=Roridomyces roridus TaxID=1738132 RepID=A0AAD7FPA4_9AGAR|nr:hypothetical protein FB45DRAFT_1002577 [Roridomyces roridus]
MVPTTQAAAKARASSSSPGATQKGKTSFGSGSDWIGVSLGIAKTMQAGGEFAPFPYIKGACGIVVSLLELVQELKHNREDLQELCEGIGKILNIVRNEVENHGNGRAEQFRDLCEDFERYLKETLELVEALAKKPRGVLGHAKELLQVNSTKERIAGHQRKLQELRENFILRSHIRIGFRVLDSNSMGYLYPVSTDNPMIEAVDATRVSPKFNECPPPSRIFQGRQRILQQMKAFFDDGLIKQHIFLLHGLGGSGKTQIALKFIDDSVSKFSDVFMLDMSSQTTIEAGLKNIAINKQIGNTQDDTLKWLKTVQSNWLLLFDNADDPDINLNPYLPKCNQGNILITSRNPGLCVHAGAHSLVPDLEEIDASELLLKGAHKDVTDENMAIAREISQALCCLPLAITQASAFIAKSGRFKGYMELYKQNQVTLLSERPTQWQDDYACSVYTTWKISFDKLSPVAQTLLQLCSWLHYQGISENIFQNAARYNTSDRPYGPAREQLQGAYEFLGYLQNQAGQWDSLAFIQVANELQAYSLITFDEETGFFSLHPLVHGWCHSAAAKQQEVMINLMGMSIATGNYSDVQSLWMLPHLQALIQDTAGRAPLWNEQFAQIYTQGFKFKLATEFWDAVQMRKQQIYGENHRHTLRAMEWLAYSYGRLGRFNDAAPLQTVVLEKWKKLLGEEHPKTLVAMGNLANTYRSLGQFNDAALLQSFVLEKRKEVLGKEHPETLWAMGYLAGTHRSLGQFTDAATLQSFILEERKKLLGEENPDTLRAMGDLAMTQRELGQFNNAALLQSFVLGKHKHLLGEEHPDTLWAMANLAVTYTHLGKYNDATLLQSFVLQTQKKLLGEDHPDTLWAMGNLAMTYIDLGRFNDAAPLQIFVLEQRKKLYGEGHLDTLWAMGNLARTHASLGKFNDAALLDTFVLQKQKELLGEEHPDTLWTKANLAEAYERLGRFNDAISLQVFVLEKRKERLGEGHPDTLWAMGDLADTHRSLGKFNDAALLETFVLEQRKKLHGEDHPDTLWAMASLARTYRSLGQFNDAASLQTFVLEGRKMLLGEEHPDTLGAMGDLALSYIDLGRFNDAAQPQTFVLEKRKKLYGEDHPDTLVAMANIAGTHRSLGQFNDAVQLESFVLEKQKILHGEEHPETLRAMANLAETYKAMAKLAEAETMEIFVLHTQKKLLGEEHYLTLIAGGRLASTFTKLGRFTEAASLECIVLENQKQLLGEDHPCTISTMKNLIETYEGLGKVEEVDVLNIQLKQAQGTWDQ